MPRFLVHPRKPRKPHVGCDFLLRGEAGRDCTPRSSGRCCLALLPSFDTLPVLPSSSASRGRSNAKRRHRPASFASGAYAAGAAGAAPDLPGIEITVGKKYPSYFRRRKHNRGSQSVFGPGSDSSHRAVCPANVLADRDLSPCECARGGTIPCIFPC